MSLYSTKCRNSDITKFPDSSYFIILVCTALSNRLQFWCWLYSCLQVTGYNYTDRYFIFKLTLTIRLNPRPFEYWVKTLNYYTTTGITCLLIRTRPVTVTAQSKAWTVFARSDAGIVGSNLTCLCLFCVCVVLCLGSDLATVWFPVQGVLQSVYKIKEMKKRQKFKKGL
jgi:hypothetical protein